MISVKTRSFEYRIGKFEISEDGKLTCNAQRRHAGLWEDVKEVRLKRLLAEFALKQNKGVRNIGTKNNETRI